MMLNLKSVPVRAQLQQIGDLLRCEPKAALMPRPPARQTARDGRLNCQYPFGYPTLNAGSGGHVSEMA